MYIEVTSDMPPIEIPLVPENLLKKNPLQIVKTAENNLIYALTKYCTVSSIHFFQVIQNNTLQMKNIFSEEDAQRFIYGINEECNQYPSSIQVYDLELVTVQKNESNPDLDGIGHSVSYSVSYPRLMEDIFTMMKPIQTISDKKQHWKVLISKHEHTTKEFKWKCYWPKTKKEKMQAQNEEDESKETKCTICKKYYIPKENTNGSCMQHSPTAKVILIDNSNPNPKKTKEIELNREEARNAKFEKKQKMYWSCCMQPYQSIGCEETKHKYW